VTDVSETAVSPAWRGLTHRVGDAAGSRFVRYLPELAMVVELTFLWPQQRDLDLEQTVCRSLCPALPAANGLQRWRAFGLDLMAGPGLAPHACVAQPGRAVFEFRHPRRPWQEEHYQRLGMLQDWLHRKPAEWFRLRLPRDLHMLAQGSCELRKHRIEQVSGTRPVRGVARLWGRRAHFAAEAWVCPTDGRLYYVSAEGPVAAPGPLAGHRLACCDAILDTPRYPSTPIDP
jgi:hypothetical protein